MTEALIASIKACRLCEEKGLLSHGANPVIQLSRQSKILIAGQAPGLKVHQSGIPFDDASGDRLRQWLGVDKNCFYDDELFAIVPMGFCYPGKASSGDLAPTKECAHQWRSRVLDFLQDIELTILIGQYAQAWHLQRLPTQPFESVTDTVRNWPCYQPAIFPLPHPSPRNNIWLKKNPWFEQDVIPQLQQCVAKVLQQSRSHT